MLGHYVFGEMILGFLNFEKKLFFLNRNIRKGFSDLQAEWFCVKNREFTLCRLRKECAMKNSKGYSGISAQQFARMVCGDEPFSVEFVRTEKDGKWIWDVQLNLGSPILEKGFLRLFEEHVFMPEPVDEAQVSMIIPPMLTKAHHNVRFDFQNAYFLRPSQRRLREEFIRALESWDRLQKILETAWEAGLLKAAVVDGAMLERFDQQNAFEIALYREAVMTRLRTVLPEIASGKIPAQTGRHNAANSGVAAGLFLEKTLVCRPE